MLNEYTKTILVDGSGDATVYLGSVIRGRIIAIKYEPGTLSTNTDLVITGETSAVAILTKANCGTSDVWFFPVAVASKVADGGASTLTEVPVYLFKERVKVVVDEGGAAGLGAITLWVDEPVIGG